MPTMAMVIGQTDHHRRGGDGSPTGLARQVALCDVTLPGKEAREEHAKKLRHQA